MNTKTTELANALWSMVAKTKEPKGKFTVNGFIHIYRRVAQNVYRIDESMTMTFLSEPLNY